MKESSKEEFMEQLVRQIKCRKARKMVIEEIDHHITDQKDYFVNEGKSEQIATEMAVEQMGDPIEIGKQLNKIHRPMVPWGVLGCVLLLSFLGLVGLTARMDQGINGDLSIRHLLFLGAGFVLALVIQRIDYTLVVGSGIWIWCGLLLGALLIDRFGSRIHGQVHYLIPYSLLFIPLFALLLYEKRRSSYGGILTVLGLGLATVWIQNRLLVQASVFLGTGLSLVILISLAIHYNWFRAKKSKAMAILWGVVTLSSALAISFLALFSSQSYRYQRFITMFSLIKNPDQYEYGYITGQVQKIIRNSSLFHGSKEKLVTEPYLINSEYILTSLVSQFGWWIGVILIICFIILMGWMIKISLYNSKPLGKLLGVACTAVFAIQGVVYIVANLGITLLGQINLPFVSYGAASLLVNFAVLGIFLSTCYYKNICQEPGKKQRWRLNVKVNIEKVQG